MNYEDALKLLKGHYGWRITAHGSEPNGSKFVIVVEGDKLHQFSETQIINMALDIHQEPLFSEQALIDLAREKEEEK
jgi:hypothetical protein